MITYNIVLNEEIVKTNLNINGDISVDLFIQYIYNELKLSGKIYIWSIYTTKSKDCIYNFINDLFTDKKNISYKELEIAVKNHFNDFNFDIKKKSVNYSKEDALKLLLELDNSIFYIPISLSYKYNDVSINYDLTKQITYDINKINKSLKIDNNIMTINKILNYPQTLININIIDENYKIDQKIKNIYYEDIKINNDLLDNMKISEKIVKNNINNNTSINSEFTKIKCKTLGYTNFSVFEIFNKIKCNDIIPLIKYKSLSNIYYKINKNLLYIDEIVNDWTVYKYDNLKTNYIEIRILPDILINVIESETKNFFDIKVIFSKPKEINFFMKKTLHEIFENIIILYNQYEAEYNTKNTMQVNNFDINYDLIEEGISKLGFYFNKIDSNLQNTIKIQYKNIDNYKKIDNINKFISYNIYNNRRDVIQALVDTFSLDYTEAENTYNTWLNNKNFQIENITNNYYFNNITAIIIKKNSQNVIEFMCNKVNTEESLNKINELMQVLVNISLDVDTDIKISEDFDDLGDFNFDFDSEEGKDFTDSFLPILKNADFELFSYKQLNKKTGAHYSLSCQKNSGRMPVVISKKDKERIDKEMPGSYTNFVQTGSTKELAKNNYYICPEYWCPKSRTPMTHEQYLQYDRKCPNPNINEEPQKINGVYWKNLEPNAPRYANFLAFNTHPKEYCVPCCFKKIPKNNNNKNNCNPNIKIEKEDNIYMDANTDLPNLYIKKENKIPLQPGEYGMLPSDVQNAFGNENIYRYGIKQDNKSFTTAVSYFMSNPYNHLNIINFLKLENGKIVRTFIDVSKSFLDKSDRNKFNEWFNGPESKKYRETFNIFSVNKDIEKREFLIYYSYLNYKEKIKNSNDYNLMLDLINFNTNNIYFIIIDVDINLNAKLMCPLNRLYENINADFAFIIKYNNYYEPIIYNKLKKFFNYINIKDVINSFFNNCGKEIKHDNELDNLIKFLNKNNDTFVKNYVIDMDYNINGLLLKNNMYIPLVKKYDSFLVNNLNYIHYTDLVKYKPVNVNYKDIIASIRNFTQDKFYDIDNIVKNEYILINKGKNIIPIDVTEEKIKKHFNRNIDIFIDNQDIDERLKRIINKNENKIDLFDFINENNEIKFLIHEENPFPLQYKRNKLYNILKQKKLNKEKIAIIIENLLISKDIKISDNKFELQNNEVIFSQTDIDSQRFYEYVLNFKNPYRFIENNVEETDKDLITAEINYIDVISKNSKFTPIMTSSPFKELLLNFEILEHENNYTPNTLYLLIHKISINIGKTTSIDNIKATIINSIDSINNIDKIRDYLNIDNNLPMTKENVMAYINSSDYHIGLYELNIISFMLKIKIIIINEDLGSIISIYQKTPFIICFIVKNGQYNLLTKNTSKYIFSQRDFSSIFKLKFNNNNFFSF